MIKQDSDAKFLKETARSGYKYAILITLGLVVIWPMPLYFSGYIFPFNFYLAWVIIALVWTGIATIVMIFKPVFDANEGILQVVSRFSRGLRFGNYELDYQKPRLDKSKMSPLYQIEKEYLFQ